MILEEIACCSVLTVTLAFICVETVFDIVTLNFREGHLRTDNAKTVNLPYY